MGKEAGCIHVYHGDGKGKTTAALGLLIRCAGQGLRVVLVQFLKNGTSGELEILRALPHVTVYSGDADVKFSFQMNAAEKEAATVLHNQNLQKALAQPCDVLILDECMAAYHSGLVDKEAIEQLVLHKPLKLELVLTGRDPAAFMLEHADYITEMRKQKHPYDRGLSARRGIEL